MESQQFSINGELFSNIHENFECPYHWTLTYTSGNLSYDYTCISALFSLSLGYFNKYKNINCTIILIAKTGKT